MDRKGKVVLATGTFDLLHYGHVYYLTEAKKTGGENAKLVVVIARDRTVEKRKGSKPIIPEGQRRDVVKALKVVDEAMLGREEMDMLGIIESIKPDIIAVGHDQGDIEEDLRKCIAEKGIEIRIVRIGRFGWKELDSSSKIKRRIIERYRR
ncbi:MAG: adenylyltransferase/cytidyltransferase family protein [Candidatus Bathyarchaeia archaeon]